MSANTVQISDRDLRLRRKAATISIAVGVILLIIKFAAYWLTGSAAVLSDALESIINVVASGFAFLSIAISARPPDETHPYGHGKIEFFSAGFEGALIVIAAIAIIWTAVPAFFHPKELPGLDIALVLLVIGGVVNWLLGSYLIRSGRKANSATLVADGKHVQTDAFTSAGVIIGLALVWVTGWYWLDPLVAVLVALNILRSGYHLLDEAVGGLMDKAEPAFLTQVAETLQRLRRPEWIAPHHLRSWRSGAVRFIDFHLVVPCYWKIYQAHAIQKEIEAALLEALDTPGQVVIHFDPCSPDYCPICAVKDCPIRSAPFREQTVWTGKVIVAGPPYPSRTMEELAAWQGDAAGCAGEGAMDSGG